LYWAKAVEYTFKHQGIIAKKGGMSSEDGDGAFASSTKPWLVFIYKK
jgi:hypothetical protein